MVLNGMKDKIMQRKTAIQVIQVSLSICLNIFCEWLQARKHVKNEGT